MESKRKQYDQVKTVRNMIISEERPLFFIGFTEIKHKILKYYGYDMFR